MGRSMLLVYGNGMEFFPNLFGILGGKCGIKRGKRVCVCV